MKDREAIANLANILYDLLPGIENPLRVRHTRNSSGILS
jgi:hypothetical protein